MQMTNNLNNDPNENLEQIFRHIDSWIQLLTQRIQFLLIDSEESGKMKINERELALDRHISLSKHLLSERQKYIMQLASSKEQNHAVNAQALIDLSKKCE